MMKVHWAQHENCLGPPGDSNAVGSVAVEDTIVDSVAGIASVARVAAGVGSRELGEAFPWSHAWRILVLAGSGGQLMDIAGVADYILVPAEGLLSQVAHILMSDIEGVVGCSRTRDQSHCLLPC